MNGLTKLAVAFGAVTMSIGAQAATVLPSNFNTTGSSPTFGLFGNARTFTSTNDPTLGMKVTAWQSHASTNRINAAYLATYSGGLGITGLGDGLGTSNLHQVDNAGSYTDFLMLQFSAPVQLLSTTLNLYQLPGVTGKDSDLSWFNAGSVIAPGQWNATVNLAGATNVPGVWTNVAGGGTGGTRALGAPASAFSQVWLLGAAMNGSARNDGFKLSGLVVQQQTPPVPEPGTWGMLILGFGAVGATLRRRRVLGRPLAA